MKTAIALSALSALFAPLAALVPQAAAAAAQQAGTLLTADRAFYPRLIRLAHQADAQRNGRIVASVSSVPADGNIQARFFVSADGGASFAPLSRIADPAWPPGLCCGTVFELPRAVGELPAGTLLYSVSIGQQTPTVPMHMPIYRSDDGGASWRYLSDCGRAQRAGGPGSGVWEPEFVVTRSGELACLYADETEPGHSQVLKITRSKDGVRWSPPALLVATLPHSERPGMPVVRRLPSGRYLMVYEHCSTARPGCEVRAKWSDDGLDWGNPRVAGEPIVAAGGLHLRHAPTIAWSPREGSPQGQVLLAGQIVFDTEGRVAPSNGRVLFVNRTADAKGPWQVIPAPLATANPPGKTNWCQNYSTPLLPSADGKTVLTLLSNWQPGPGSPCQSWFGSGAVAD
jgi:hypothetical protein